MAVQIIANFSTMSMSRGSNSQRQYICPDGANTPPSNHLCLFAQLISRTFSANEQYFSLTTNQSTVLSAMAYQPSEHSILVSLIYPIFNRTSSAKHYCHGKWIVNQRTKHNSKVGERSSVSSSDSFSQHDSCSGIVYCASSSGRPSFYRGGRYRVIVLWRQQTHVERGTENRMEWYVHATQTVKFQKYNVVINHCFCNITQ